MTDALWILLAAGGVMAAVIGCLTLLNNRYTLNNIKSKTVGDGQHGTARWATDAEIRKTYALVPFQAASWRKGLHRPEVQGLVLGSISHKHGITALVDKDDVHCLTPMLADAMNWYIELSPLRLCNLASTNPSPTWIILTELILLTFVSVLTGIYRKYRHEVL